MAEVQKEPTKVLILTKKDKLDKLKINRQVFGQDNQDTRDQGELLGEYKGVSLIGTIRNVTPEWCDLREKWCFNGTVEDLKAIQKKLKLKDGNNQLIVIDEDTMYNREDPFWGNMRLWTTMMTEGRKVLSSDDALSDLFIRVLEDTLTIEQEGKDQSKADIGDADFKITSPTSEAAAKFKTLDKDLEVSAALFNMDHKVKKAILDIMQPPGYDSSENDHSILTSLLHTVSKDTRAMDNYTKKTWQDRFIELSKEPAAKLGLQVNVFGAINKGIIRRDSTNGYAMNGVRIEEGTITTDGALVKFYTDPLNSKEYDNLLNQISLK